MIKYYENPFSIECEKIALDDATKTYADACRQVGLSENTALVHDQDGALVEDKTALLSNVTELKIYRVPEGGDSGDVLKGIAFAALIVALVVTGNYAIAFEVLLAAGSAAYQANIQKRLANVQGPGQDDFDAISAQFNKNLYGHPMPICIGKGRIFPDFSMQPYSRMEGKWEDPLQATYGVYTFGAANGVTFSDLKSEDTKLDGSDGVEVHWGDASGKFHSGRPLSEIETLLGISPAHSVQAVDVGDGAELSKPLSADTEPSVSYAAKQGAGTVEFDLVYAAGHTTQKGRTKQHSVVFFLEENWGGSWHPVEYKRLTLSRGLGSSPGSFFTLLEGNAADGVKFISGEPGMMRCKGHHGTPHRGTIGFRIPYRINEPVTVRVTFKVPYNAHKSSYTADLGIEQFRSYYPDRGDYSGQKRLLVKYYSDGPWSRQLPPLSAAYQASAEGVVTANPAYWFLHFLKQSGLPVSMIDTQSIDEWKIYCQGNDLEYNRVVRPDIKIADLLTSIAVVGHAKMAPIRGKLGVVLFEDQTIVREFTLDDQVKNPPMSVSVSRKPKITGLEIVYFDMHTGELKPINIGSAPFERIQIPGITRKQQAANELKKSWDEMQINYPVVTFAADQSALDLYRGQRIKIHGQPGVFTGVSECRVLSAKSADEGVTVTARIEVAPIATGDPVHTSVARPVAYLAFMSEAIQIKAKAYVFAVDHAYISLSWRNRSCSGQDIKIINESGTAIVMNITGTQASAEIPLENQTFIIEFTPRLSYFDEKTSLGTKVKSVLLFVDIAQLLDTVEPEHPKIRGMKLVHIDRRAEGREYEFSGSDCSITWQRLTKFHRFYRVRVYDEISGKKLRSDNGYGNGYTYDIGKNKADTLAQGLPQAATRHLRFTVAGMNTALETTRVGSIVVHNLLPKTPQLSPYIIAAGYIEIKITSAPTDPDFMGYLIWMGESADFQPSGAKIDSGNCIKTLDARSSSFSVSIDPGQTRYVKVAAFDDFTSEPQKLNVSAGIKLTGVKLLDIPDIETRLNVGWNQITFNDGGALVDASGNPVYDLGDATPAARERFQQFLAAGLRGIKPPFKAWHADLIDGSTITANSMHADRIQAGTLEARHLKANSTWSVFLSSNEMDIKNIYYDRYEYDSGGQLLTNPDGTPIIKPGGGEKLFDYIEGKIAAPQGQFQHLEVELGGLVQSFGAKKATDKTIPGGYADGLGYGGFVIQNRSLIIAPNQSESLPLNRAIQIKSGDLVTKTITSQQHTGTVQASTAATIRMYPPHNPAGPQTWSIFVRQVLYAKRANMPLFPWTPVAGGETNVYGPEITAMFRHRTDPAHWNTPYYHTVELNDTLNVRLGDDEIEELWLGVQVGRMYATPVITATDAVNAVKALSRDMKITSLDMTAMCILNRHKNG